MTNQTFSLFVFLGIGLIVGFVYFMRKAAFAKQLNKELSEALLASDNKNAQLLREIAMKNISWK